MEIKDINNVTDIEVLDTEIRRNEKRGRDIEDEYRRLKSRQGSVQTVFTVLRKELEEQEAQSEDIPRLRVAIEVMEEHISKGEKALKANDDEYKKASTEYRALKDRRLVLELERRRAEV